MTRSIYETALGMGGYLGSPAHAEDRAEQKRAIRTFGDVADRKHFCVETYHACRFCKKSGIPLAYYSTRHLVCKPCCEDRRDEILPKVKKWEAFKARMDAAGRTA